MQLKIKLRISQELKGIPLAPTFRDPDFSTIVQFHRSKILPKTS